MRDGFQSETAGILPADFDGEGVIKSERLAEFEIKPLGVFRLDPVVDLVGIARRLLFQNCGQGGAGVFGVDINAAAKNGLLANVAARQVETALDRQVGLVLDLLRDDFTEDELLGEIFGADDDDVRRVAVRRR